MKTKFAKFELEGLDDYEVRQVLDFASKCLKEDYEVTLNIKQNGTNQG